MTTPARNYTDALERALGRVIADGQRQIELIAAKADAALSELRAHNAELLARLAETERGMAERIDAGIREGVEQVEARLSQAFEEKSDMLRFGAVARLDDVEHRMRELETHAAEYAERLAAVESRAPEVGTGDLEEMREGLIEKIGAQREEILASIETIRGEPGPAGDRGPEGPPGQLRLCRAWADGVHYQGEVVTHAGGTWQARCDTGREPPHGDWICLAAAGRDGVDGRSPQVRDTWREDADYAALDIVALGGNAFIARMDNPGPCPGDGWQLIAMRGKSGKPGEKGPKGEKGDQGNPGEPVISAEVADDGRVILTNGDGSTVEVDLYPLLDKVRK